MADWFRREVTTTRVEYVLPSPTNCGELYELLSAVERDLKGASSHIHDVAVVIEGRDGELVVWYDKAFLNG